MKKRKVGVGVIGCGAISETYLPNMVGRFSVIELIGVADLIPERAAEAAAKYHTRAMTNEEIYACPEIEVVVNLTNVWSHFEVTKAALLHGKHVYSEKMMAEDFFRAKELYDLAAEKSLRLAMAPDTCLGGGYQTVRKLVDDGFIGKPFCVTAELFRGYLQEGPEVAEYNVFKYGGTIPFDMGGYYIHAMQTVFGAVKRVSGFGSYLHKTYSNPANPKYGEDFTVENAPNFVQASLEFDCDVYGSLTVGDYGVMKEKVEGLHIFGTEGTLICPDPNLFCGPIRLLRKGAAEFENIPILFGYNGSESDIPGYETDHPYWKISRRGVGVADLCWAIVNDRPQRLSNEMGLHTIEIIHGVTEGAKSGQYYNMTTHPKRMQALRPGFVGGDAEAVFDDYYDNDFHAEPAWKW